MTEWSKQAEEMFNTWRETQKSLMDKWVESIKSFTGTQNTEMWKKTLETWEETAKNTFNSQTDWMKSWIENLKSMEGLPEGAVESIDRFQEMAGRWNKTQDELWAKWFEMLKDFWKGEYREVPWYTIAISVAAVLYFINPFDIIIDVIPGAGYIDDVVVIGFVYKAIHEDLKTYCKFKGYDPDLFF